MKQFKIAFNGRFSGTLRPTGTQIVAFNLFDAIIRSSRDFNIVTFADTSFPGVEAWINIPQTEVVLVPFTQWPRMRSQLWEQLLLPLRARQWGAELIHHPISTCPRWKLGLKTIVTLHDLNFYRHPEWVAPNFRRWMMTTAVPGMRAADHVATISNYVLADARQTLGLSVEKTSRIYNGLKPMAVRPGTIKADQSVPIVLGVNLWQPHKNLQRLITAISILRHDFPNLELHLAGRPQAQFQEQPELRQSLNAPFIRVLGYLSEEDLAKAYAGATVFCYPSLEEGFGLPILEAMAMGTPVATSNSSCLPEIAGGAAILFDPTSEEEMARGIRQALMESEAERERRIVNGYAVAGKFTWTRAAKEYIQLYEQLLA
ncbi:MAG: glycosyltransferase family 4 protein [Methylacidiphilales bacterium]|nr:glycosyltransferase family 4 protein [Candidatus Methylacidiphilales bacterium]